MSNVSLAGDSRRGLCLPTGKHYASCSGSVMTLSGNRIHAETLFSLGHSELTPVQTFTDPCSFVRSQNVVGSPGRERLDAPRAPVLDLRSPSAAALSEFASRDDAEPSACGSPQSPPHVILNNGRCWSARLSSGVTRLHDRLWLDLS